MCRKKVSLILLSNTFVGILPRMWEKRSYTLQQHLFCGNTPTCVGKRNNPYISALGVKEHSHVCGKNIWENWGFFLCMGTLPRMWEKRIIRILPPVRDRNTPTYVGKTLRIYAICVNFCYLLYRNFLHFLFPLLIW